MTAPIVINLPHTLGAEEAKRRIAGGMGRLTNHIPGAAEIESSWEGDRLNLLVKAMGQAVDSHIDVGASNVRVEVTLPPFLAMFAGTISGFLSRRGSELLEDKSKK
jgi:putative polyhydroxyalkanoate system protein